MDDLLQEFIAETRETLEALAGGIVMWEADPSDRTRLDAIFRFVHTVKGSCGFLDLPRLLRLSHAAEDTLAAVRSGARKPDTRTVNAVLAIVDRIGEIIEAIDIGVSLDDRSEDLLIAALAEGADSAVAQASGISIQRAPTRSIRLSVALLDRMMSGMSDMVLARNELARHLRDHGAEPSVEAALERLSLTVADMRDTVTQTRMQKIDALFSVLPRMVRDTAAELNKAVALSVEGANVELDREMIEMMRDPLVHMIRNAIDHGLESSVDRIAAGKNPVGNLLVVARQLGNQIIIEIQDDGRGIDVDRLIINLAASSGQSEAALRMLPEQAQLDLIFHPGLSSKDNVTTISGRGVGMDVVRANIEQLGGRIDLRNTPGRGLCIAIHVPLTLSIIPTIIVGVSGQRFALSRPSIEEIVRVRGDAIRIDALGDTMVATIRKRRFPLLSLAKLLGLPSSDEPPATLVVVTVTGGSFALAVDEVLDTEELVIKPAPPAVMATGLFAGQTLPDTGLPMLLLDAAGLASAGGLRFNSEARAPAGDEKVSEGTPSQTMLIFRDIDGAKRLAPLATIERVEPVDRADIQFTAGQWRLSVDAMIIPLATVLDDAARYFAGDETRLSVLRIADGQTQIAYLITEAIDIVELTDAMIAGRGTGPIAGVATIDGEQVEIIDVHWVFARYADGYRSDTAAPVLLLAGESTAWMESFLRPVLENAGYRVRTALRAGEHPSVTLAMDSDTLSIADATPVIRLRHAVQMSANAGETIFRYDRAALLQALDQCRAGERAG